MLPKSFSLLMLIVATQLSQNFAAPRDGLISDINLSEPIKTADPAIESTKEFVPSEQLTNPTGEIVENLKSSTEGVDNIAQIPSAAIDSAQSAGEQVGEKVENSIQSANNQAENVVNAVPSAPEATAAAGKCPHSHQLTREQEKDLLHKLPEFKEIIQAMEKLPDGVYEEMKAFLDSTVPRMPDHNLFTHHFKNAAVLVHMFERLVKAERTGAIHEPASQDLLDRVHKAAPVMRREMHQFQGIMDHAQSRLANLGTMTNPTNEEAKPYAGVDVSTGSISLPSDVKPETSASESATPAVATE